MAEEIDYIENQSFVGKRDDPKGLSPLAASIEEGSAGRDPDEPKGLPAHLARMCSTPLLSPEEERELFRRMNFCKHRAVAIRSRLSRSRPDEARLAEAEDYLLRARRLRDHLIQANTRLVMSIARKFADQRNPFDDLLSHGLSTLMHSIEKFDYARGYRFSTYATCAVRRDLYRMVMKRRRDSQRFATGADEQLGDCPDPADSDRLSEAGWRRLRDTLQEMVAALDDRERFILVHRFGMEGSGKKTSYSRMGERLGISKERVRQLFNRAMEKLREAAPGRRLEGMLG